jgi:uncharacterized protein YneF (UPF0154 family)
MTAVALLAAGFAAGFLAGCYIAAWAIAKQVVYLARNPPPPRLSPAQVRMIRSFESAGWSLRRPS